MSNVEWVLVEQAKSGDDHHLTGYGVGAGGKHTQKYFVVDNVYPNAIGDAMDGWIYTTMAILNL